MLVKFPEPVVPLSEADITQEAKHILDALAVNQEAHVSEDFLNRCSFDDCLQLLELLPYQNMVLNVPFRPYHQGVYFTRKRRTEINNEGR